MSYQNLIDSNLKKAFNLVKDLAKVGTFSRKSATSFDFGTGQATSTAMANVTAKVILLDAEKTSEKTNVVKRQMMVKSKELDDLKAYDTVTVGSEVWKIGQPIKNSGFIYLLEVYKES